MGWQAAAPQMHLSKRGFGTFRTNEECSWGVVQEDRVRLGSYNHLLISHGFKSS